MKKILILPGDGIGPEIVEQAVKVLDVINTKYNLTIECQYGAIGGCAIEQYGVPFPTETLELAKWADAILLGAVGGPQWDHLEMSQRPEKGLLSLRSELDLFANLRPAISFPQLSDASSLKREIVSGLDIMIVRELTGGIYFGEPRGVRVLDSGVKQGFNTYIYDENEIERIARVAFESARLRNKKVCSVDKANVLEVTVLWRQVLDRVGQEYPDVELTHMYVDNAAMQLVKNPKQFDVIVTGNMFGDILSDCAAMLTGSIGMLPSASLNSGKQGLYEPIHGSAPDISGQGIANPLATILSVAMMMRYSFDRPDISSDIERAIERVLEAGGRTADLQQESLSNGEFVKPLSTAEMGQAVIDCL